VARQTHPPGPIAVEPIGAVTEAPAPIPVVAMFRWAPPFGDGAPQPTPAVAVAWTTAQVRVRGSGRRGIGPGGGPRDDAGVWLPARDVHRVHAVPTPWPVLARVRTRTGATADVPGLVLARATTRTGRDVAVRVLLAPDTDDAEERWLLTEALVDADPLSDVPD
jgi:hypothetical protein